MERAAEAYRAAKPELAAELDMIVNGTLPDGWDADIPTFRPEDGRSPPARRPSR